MRQDDAWVISYAVVGFLLMLVAVAVAAILAVYR